MDNFDEKINLDTASKNKIDEVSEKLVQHLKEQGDVLAAEHVEYLVKDSEKDSEKDKIISDPNYTKILKTNEEILSVLKKIHEDMIDEQDTSIKKSQKTSSIYNTVYNQNFYNEGAEEGGLGFNFGTSGLLPRMPKFGGKTPEKTPSKTSKIPPKAAPAPSQEVKKTPKKVSKIGNIGKNALKIGKVAGKLFLPLTIGMGIYDSVQGWNNAKEVFGVEEEELTTAHKLSSAVGSFVSGLTFGLVDAESASKKIINGFKESDEVNKTKTNETVKKEITEFEKQTSDKSKENIIKIQEKINNTQKTIDEHKEIIKNTTDAKKITESENTILALENVKQSLKTYIENESKNIIEEQNSINPEIVDAQKSETDKSKSKKYDSKSIQPIKTSSINPNISNVSNDTLNNINQTILNKNDVQINKQIREQSIDKSSSNLKKQTNIYNSNINKESFQTLLTPIINNTIASQKPTQEVQPLDIFTRR